MRILKLDTKKGYMKAIVDTYDDLWALSIVIKPGDIVGMRTTRKVKISFGDRTEAERKPMFLKIRVSKVSFHGFTSALRISGEIIEGPEDVKGSHTFSVEPGSLIEVWKEFGPEEIEILKEHTTKIPRFAIVLVDRDSALIFFKGEKIWINSNLPSKGEEGEENAYKTFFGKIRSVLDSFSPEFIIVAGPGFVKERLAKFLNTPYIDSASSVSEAGLREIFARGVVSKFAGVIREEEEEKWVNRIYEEISKGGKVFYGLEEAKKFVNEGNVQILLIAASLISNFASRGKYAELRDLMKKVKYMGAKILVVGLNRDAEIRLEGLGGIAGIRRW